MRSIPTHLPLDFMNRTFTRLVLPLLLLAFITTASHAAEKRPNILLVITDDESWLERGAYGWAKIPTSHFDRIAREGALFTNAYSSAPSCAPSRAALLTGRNFWELEQGAFIQAWLPEKFPVLPDLLRAGGYHAGRIGKGWGPGVHPAGSHGPDVAGRGYNRIKLAKPERAMTALDYAGNFAALLADRRDGQPFFCWLGMQEPHDPWAPGNHVKLKERYGLSPEQIPVPAFLEDNEKTRTTRANMLYETCRSDEMLGEVLAVLEKNGELDDTIIIVTSDNGTACGQSKAGPYDWGTHVPFAIRWPGKVKPGRVVEDFIGSPDIAPTLLAAAGVPVPDSMSGRSFMDILISEKSGRIDPTRDHIVTGLEWHGELPPANRASRTIRDDRYQYIINHGTNPITNVPEELYDLEKDPAHRDNLIADSAHAETRDRLKKQLRDLQLKTGDPRATGEMEIFDTTRAFVEARKAKGYGSKAEKE